ncbi:TRAP transporter 4TM/12TM fusion protein [Halomonas campaniensis]|uniref:TRAP transporter 4TM/12TM fusion protein n=1 Tax=Halomonas campaniensis TaxID=213554 RepID=A0A7W5K2Y3_9GAMM|nr:TRAP transporter permease [Halomonas campaniensis]MBB3330972.1 TRAP transporter 4TM/12TM fusion protein [Halomonas campaniensis]
MTLSHDTFRTGLKHTVTALAVAMSFYHIMTAFFGTPISEVHLPVHLGFALVIIFWTYRKPAAGSLGALLILRDLGLTAMAVGGCAFLALNSAELQQRMLYFDPLTTPQLLFGAMLVFTVLEAARRVVGWPLVILGATAIAYALWGNYLPSVLWHRGYSFESIIESTYLTQDGLWTTPLRVTATYVFLFVLFGAFLVSSGAGTFFTDLARSLTGRFTGGAAKTAVVSSALMGSLSGSSAGNVVVTGSFTIPTMKRAGFPPRFAAGVEAVSSSGGQFMPPVMGSAAFIMAEFIGMPYIEIAQAAIIPALLYFISVIAMVHFEARRLELSPEVADVRAFEVLKQRGYLLLPVIVMLGVLSSGYTPTLAALYALGSLVLAQVVFERESRTLLVENCLKAMNDAPRIIGQITIASAVGGIIVGVVTQTGLGLRMSSIVLSISQGSLPLLLVLTMLCGVILGMGMPTPAAYIILAVLLAPGLVEFGVPILAAHLFVMYCAGVSAITPPVALASYAAAAIADSDPWRTSLTALKLGLASFIVPYMFVFAPSILGLGSGLQMTINSLAAGVGVIALAASLIGWLWIRMNLYLRGLLFAAALMLIMPGMLVDLAGGVLIVVIATYCFVAGRQQGRREPIRPPVKQDL